MKDIKSCLILLNKESSGQIFEEHVNEKKKKKRTADRTLCTEVNKETTLLNTKCQNPT